MSLFFDVNMLLQGCAVYLHALRVVLLFFLAVALAPSFAAPATVNVPDDQCLAHDRQGLLKQHADLLDVYRAAFFNDAQLSA
ncbi:Type I secretion outer membrane protein, TolC, partial [Pseudomonas savastanoi pv. fraxini]